MKEYITKLLPRLKKFSESLDKKELFVDVPWVIVDEKQNQEKYIFKRNGDLIMSLNGQVTIGKWEYLSSAKSLLIDRITDKILLNQNFIDAAVMILKKDGLNDHFFFFANELLIPTLDVSAYIKKLYHQKHQIHSVELIDGKSLEIHDWSDSYVETNDVTIDGEKISDGIYELSKTSKKYVVRDSKIYKILFMDQYITNKGKIIVEAEINHGPRKGDRVFQDQSAAPDGRYRLSFMNYITIKDGEIV